ncbi:hypothetical protein SAMN02910369_02241 [Lachnospiraceae bacterium NE2001]|nr:hypothetical protein SAMN02910369_02241 [Lachnospiraceae bacterium NE2001]
MNNTLPYGNIDKQLNIGSDKSKDCIEISDKMSLHPHDIFDRIFKRIITLSSTTIVRFINGIFGTDYSLDSTITYNWTENVDDKLKKTIADTIITINGTDSYHLEAQMYKDDESILLRVFDYGYNHSKRHPEDIFDENGVRCGVKLLFPKQVVIYLDAAEYIPDEYQITLVVNEEKEFSFEITTIKFQNESMQEIISKHMIILLPFKLLKVRDKFRRAYEATIKEEQGSGLDCNPDNNCDNGSSTNSDNCSYNYSDYNSPGKSLQEAIQELRDIYQRDIIKTIEDSYKSSDITRNDMNLLLQLTTKLFDYLYSKYSSIEEVDTMLHDESLDLDVDRYIDTIEDLKTELNETNKTLDETNKALDESNKANVELMEEILRLKKELEQIKNS